MKLTDYTLVQYLELLQSDAPAPGGGTASALAGAQGIALLRMVCALTLGKEKYAASQEICLAAQAACEPLTRVLADAISADAAAYDAVFAAYKMPKGTEDEKRSRGAAIAAATLHATEIPFSVLQAAVSGLSIAASLAGNTNPNADSDLGSAVANLRACATGAWLNVKINLPGVKDEAKAEYFRTQGEKYLAEAAAF